MGRERVLFSQFLQREAVPLWMVCYVLLGFVQSGMVPVILPLSAKPGPLAGLTYAAFAAAGIAAPFIGAWSDRHRRHRWTLAGGLALAGLGLLGQAIPGGTGEHLVLAALVGLGASSATTVATMFIVEVEPDSVWDRRIGTLQAALGSGQLLGLLTAGALGLRHVDDAFLLGAVLLLLAVPLALILAPDPVVKVSRPALVPAPERGSDAAVIGLHRSLHRVTWRAVAALARADLARFLAAWLVSYTATNGLAVMFAVAMVRLYHTAATLPTSAYAIGVGCSLLIYDTVSRWDARYGAWRVLRVGFGARAVVVGAMAALASLHLHATVLPILVCFALTQLIWPLLAVASTTLSVTLSPARRAESVGLLNAATAFAASVGGLFGGFLLRIGFAWLCIAVLAALMIAFLLAYPPPGTRAPAG